MSYIKHILMLFFHLREYLRRGLFPSETPPLSPPISLYAPLLFFIRATFPAHILRRGTFKNTYSLPTVASPYHYFKVGMLPSSLTADAWFAADQKISR